MVLCSILLILSQFADDSTVTYSSDDLDLAIETIEEEFNRILDWLAANKLIINLNKTHLMLFTNRIHKDAISIKAKGQTITEITETKFLGVILDNKLTWEAHIKYISQKISKSVSILRMLKHTFPTNALKTIYHSLIYPYYTYCNLIWGCAENTHLEPLVLLQKKCIRNISKVGYLDHTEPLFSEHKVLTVKEIYKYSCSKFIYQCYNNRNYLHFKDKLKRNNEYHNYKTRDSNLLRQPFIRLHKFRNSFLPMGIRMWNKIPERIKSSRSYDTFKIKSKRLILENKNI